MVLLWKCHLSSALIVFDSAASSIDVVPNFPFQKRQNLEISKPRNPEIAIIANYQNHVCAHCDLKCAPSEARGDILIFDETLNALLRHQTLLLRHQPLCSDAKHFARTLHTSSR